MRKLLLLSFHFWLALNMVNGQLVNIKATGTGQTTGHIANLTVHNEADTPVKVLPQTAYIPSGGQYQPYVAEIPPTTIPPGATVEIPLSGYCADVHTPPVPNGTSMSPIDTWLPVGSTTDPGSGVPILPQPPLKPFDPIDIPGITGSPGFTPGPIPITPEPIPTWPGTDHPVTGIFDPINHPKPFAPVIVEALNEIANAFDKLREDGKIQTPFSGDPVKEREGVIQQTFWIYMAAITGEEYGKGDFTGKVHDQYSSTTGRPVTSLTEEQKREMDVGIDHFWTVFTIVGTEAKVLDESALIANSATMVVIVDELSTTDRYKQELKNCFFSRLEYSVLIEHMYSRGSGNKKKSYTDVYHPNEKNEVDIKLQKDDTLTINLVDPKCQCPCWTAKDKDGQKSGPLCDCAITGVSQRSFNEKVFTDLMEQDVDNFVVDSVKNEIAKKIEDLKNKGGKKSEIDKLQKQLDDEKKLRKENAARIEELKKKLNGPWRLANKKTQTSFKVKAGFTGQVEFVFDVQGKCTGTDPCKSSEWSREVKVKVNVPK